jgi:hypothetical protein
VKIIKVRTGDPQVAVSCLGGCLLLIGWVGVGVANLALMWKYEVASWQAAIIGIVWLLSGPVCAVAYFKWRGLRHTRAFIALETKMTRKRQEQLRKKPPDNP